MTFSLWNRVHCTRNEKWGSSIETVPYWGKKIMKSRLEIFPGCGRWKWRYKVFFARGHPETTLVWQQWCVPAKLAQAIARAEVFSDRLGSTHDLSPSARTFSFSSKIRKLPFFAAQIFFPISHAFSLYFWLTLLQILLVLHEMTNFLDEKKMELKSNISKKKSSSVPAWFQLEN